MKKIIVVIICCLFVSFVSKIHAETGVEVDVIEKVRLDQEISIFIRNETDKFFYVYFNDDTGATIFGTCKNFVLTTTPKELYLEIGINHVKVVAGDNHEDIKSFVVYDE